MRSIILIIAALLFSTALFSQKVVVMNEYGESIPYLYFVGKDGKALAVSNSNGEIDLGLSSLADTLELTVRSEFYVPLKFSVKYLKKAGSITVNFRSNVLDAAIVMPQETLREIVLRAAEDFGRRYIRNYLCTVDYKRFIYSGERYLQMYLAYGLTASLRFTQKTPPLHFDDNNINSFGYVPIDAFITDFFPPGSDVPMTTFCLDSDNMNIAYWNMCGTEIIQFKRAIEIYSPVNSKMADFFRYWVIDKRETSSGTSYTIGFSTKPGVFPRKTKLFGSGKMTISSGVIESVEIENMEQRYYMRFHNKSPEPEIVIPYIWRVEYAEAPSGIYTKKLALNQKWELPEGAEGVDWGNQITWKGLHPAERIPPYKHALRNRLRTETEIVFGGIIEVTDGKTISKFSKSSLFYFYTYMGVYVDDVNEKFWGVRLKKLGNLAKIKADLYDSRTPLLEQAKGFYERILPELRYLHQQWLLERSQKFQERIADEDFVPTLFFKDTLGRAIPKYTIGREMFRILYGREYYNE